MLLPRCRALYVGKHILCNCNLAIRMRVRMREYAPSVTLNQLEKSVSSRARPFSSGSLSF